MKTPHAILIAAVALASGYGLALIPERPRLAEPGTVYADVGETDIRLLSYTGTRATLTAQRSGAGSQFAVQVTFADGRPAQHCTASGNLAGKLGNFARLFASRGITLEQRKNDFPIFHGVLDIRSALSPEFAGPYLLFTDRSRQTAVSVAYGSATVLTVPIAIFDQLESGCGSITP